MKASSDLGQGDVHDGDVETDDEQAHRADEEDTDSASTSQR
jgi:hypothetical protein